ncbi:MAG: hypothetical protein IJZ62_04455 [Clostridia bacterium]|nr:hypothetical protein [Clostridia bacterium]
MKKVLCLLLMLVALFSCGCGEKSFSCSQITQDAYKTGGSLTFEYDPSSHTAYFGEAGESIEYYEADIAKGWTQEGNRIGFKLFMPQDVDDYMSASAIINDTQLEYDDFIFGDEIKYAQFQPLVSEENNIIDLKITWQSGSKEQEYKIIIKNGTHFVEKTTN